MYMYMYVHYISLALAETHPAHWVIVLHLGLGAVHSLGSCGSLIFSSGIIYVKEIHVHTSTCTCMYIIIKYIRCST